MGVEPNEIALTDSTTMGTALMINGMQIREDQEMLTAEFDYYSTHRSIEYKSGRTGASFRKIPLYRDVQNVTEDEIIDNLIGEIKSNTRLVTGTWVHSSTGLKIPVRKISNRLAEVNAGRGPEDRVLFFVDGAHGLGVEDTFISDLGCDFFSAGTHKWMFGPRGTGVLWGNPEVHNQVSPTIPTFTNGAGWGGRMSPGGFKPFEHQWAMEQAFRFHLDIGKERVQERIHSLALQLKEGLNDMQHVLLYTPMEKELSSGIICFDIDGMSPNQVVNRLEQKNVIASDTPYNPTYSRLAPGIFNTPEDIENVIRAVRDLS